MPSIDDERATEAAELNRRRFLGIVTASLAAAGVGCGRWDDRGPIAPYATQAEGVIPGVPRYYASTLAHYPGSPAVIVTTREGRPIKLEGNPQAGCGGPGAFGEAAILDLYDPDRLRAPALDGRQISWEQADGLVTEGLRKASSAGKAILLVTPPLVSPTARKLVGDFLAAYPSAKHLTVALFGDRPEIGARLRAFGIPSLTRVHWDKADVVLSMDADLFGPDFQPADCAAFASRRGFTAGRPMNRLWAVESGLTGTGALADHRIPLRPSLQGYLLCWLLAHCAVARQMGALSKDFNVATVLGAVLSEFRPSRVGIPGEIIATLADDLGKRPGRSVVAVGPALPASFHVLAAALNCTLGAEPAVVEPIPAPAWTATSESEWARTIELIRRDRVDVLICLQANPVYLLPPELGLAPALEQIPLIAASSLLPNETSQHARLVLPAAHDLESWGDGDGDAGRLSLQQPAIAPLHDVRSDEDSLLLWTRGDAPRHRDYLKARWRDEVYSAFPDRPSFEDFWNRGLESGSVEVRSEPRQSPAIRPEAIVEAIIETRSLGPSGTDLVLNLGGRMYDGRFANNAWLQELPHPVTTQVWGNGALIGPGTAASHGIKEGQNVTVTLGRRSVTLPALVEPGMADDTVILEMGYGRTNAGAVGTGVGVDVSPLRALEGGASPRFYPGAELTPAPSQGRVVRVQQHSQAGGRSMVREATRAMLEDSAPARAPLHADSDAGAWQYKGHKWGMVIDLSSCSGCGACTIACVAENNIPVVGPEQVAKGREMHWLRIDRYYVGDPRNPRTLFQPMLCQQCDYAPCEKVCPVAATVHSPEGLDEMVYNRCVGTRYCANNCPYKVRRFNFFDYRKQMREPAELALNPEVTVRSRGVMEKCTFCVQRISAAKQQAKIEGRALRDGDVRTACQRACPTGAITFGDLNAPDSQVHRLSSGLRGYQVLAELGTGPAITYLVKVRNPHPGLKL